MINSTVTISAEDQSRLSRVVEQVNPFGFLPFSSVNLWVVDEQDTGLFLFMVHTFDLRNKRENKKPKKEQIFVITAEKWMAKEEIKVTVHTHEGQNGYFLSLYHTNIPCLIGVGSERQTYAT